MKSTSDEVDYSDACAFDPHDPEIRAAVWPWVATFDDEVELEMPERVLVRGGRDFSDAGLVNRVLSKIHRERGISCIIEGDARGADCLASAWSVTHGIANAKFPADWEKDGKAAGPMRNARMLTDGAPTVVVAFPGGRGTADMVRKARSAGVQVVAFDDEVE